MDGFFTLVLLQLFDSRKNANFSRMKDVHLQPVLYCFSEDFGILRIEILCAGCGDILAKIYASKLLHVRLRRSGVDTRQQADSTLASHQRMWTTTSK